MQPICCYLKPVNTAKNEFDIAFFDHGVARREKTGVHLAEYKDKDKDKNSIYIAPIMFLDTEALVCKNSKR